MITEKRDCFLALVVVADEPANDVTNPKLKYAKKHWLMFKTLTVVADQGPML